MKTVSTLEIEGNPLNLIIITTKNLQLASQLMVKD